MNQYELRTKIAYQLLEKLAQGARVEVGARQADGIIPARAVRPSRSLQARHSAGEFSPEASVPPAPGKTVKSSIGK